MARLGKALWSNGWLAVVVLAGFGCGLKPAVDTAKMTFAGKHPIHVVATTGIVAEMVEKVGGDHVQVHALMGEGVDPHLYKASPGDIEKLQSADMVFYSGLHLEGKLADILERLSRKKPTHAVSDTIDESKLLRDEGGAIDPHIWFDLSLWRQGVAGVVEELSTFDPSHAEDYAKRGAEYEKQLDELHLRAKELLAKVPADRRVLVTAHDAFGYFARAYDMEVRAVQGISTDTEAGLADVGDLVDFIVQRGIKAVFIENIVSERNIQSLVEGCQAKGHQVVIGGELFSDALGKQGTQTGTFLGMVQHNVDTIVHALE